MFEKFKSVVKEKVEKILTAKERFTQAIKRPEIIEPYLNNIDSYFLNDDVSKNFEKSNKEGQPGSEKFRRIMKKHFVNDIFNLFYNNTTDTKLSVRDESNNFRYKLLEKVNRSGIKIVSNKSTFASTLYTQEIAKYFYNLYKDLPPEQLKKLEQMMDGEGEEGEFKDGEGEGKGKGNGDGKGKETKGESGGKSAGKGDSDAFVEEMTKILDSAQSEKQLEAAIKEAEKKVEMIEQSGLEVNESNAREIIGKVDILEKHRSDIMQLNVSKDAILKAVKKILDKSTSYFSARYKVDEVDIYSAEEMNSLEGIEFLHPMFRKGMIDELITREKRFFGRFSLYVKKLI